MAPKQKSSPVDKNPPDAAVPLSSVMKDRAFRALDAENNGYIKWAKKVLKPRLPAAEFEKLEAELNELTQDHKEALVAMLDGKARMLPKDSGIPGTRPPEGTGGPHPNLSTLGARIQFARKRAGLSQQQVADFFMISAQAVSQWERNIHAPELSRAIAISELFRVTSQWLIDGVEPETLKHETPRAVGEIEIVDRPFRGHRAIGNTNKNRLAVEPSRLYGSMTFAFIVPDNANYPIFMAGDIVIVDPDATPLGGDYVAVGVAGPKFDVRQLTYASFGEGDTTEFPNNVILTPGDPRFQTYRRLDSEETLESGDVPAGKAAIFGPVLEKRRYSPARSGSGRRYSGPAI